MKQYRPSARGAFGDVVVVMDSTSLRSPVADAIRSTFGQTIYTIPAAPHFMDLRFTSFSTQNELERIKKSKNIIIAAPIHGEGNTAKFIRALLGENAEQQVEAGHEFSFILQNQWYKNQWLLILTAPDAEALAKKIASEEARLTNSLLQKELDRWSFRVYDDKERLEVEEHLWDDYGWKIRVKHDWSAHLDTAYTENGITKHLFTMQRITAKNDRRFWAWWVHKPVNIDTLSTVWMNELRNEVWQIWFRGSEKDAYITTSTKRPTAIDTLLIDGHITYETLGVWRMAGAVMAGPFVSMLIYDERTARLFMIGFLQFAPSVKQRPYMRQFRAMLRTFTTDSLR